MAQGVVYQSGNGEIISANPAAERILGLTLDQMQGRKSIDPRWKAIHEDGSDFPGESHPAMVSIKTGLSVHDVVMGVFHPDEKKHRWIIVDSTPQIKAGDKKPYQVYTTFRDITERKQAEEVLELFQFSVSNSRDAVYLMGPNAHFINVSDSACNAIGYSREELLTMNVHDIGPGFPVEVWPAHWDDLRKRGSFLIETTHQRKDGSIFPVEISVNYIKYAEKEFNCAFARDITERVQVEQALKEAHDTLEVRVKERTHDLNIMVKSMAGREVRMAELKQVIKKLRKQLREAGLEPVADDSLIPSEDGF
jgi:PAS domain S-box-containing protein